MNINNSRVEEIMSRLRRHGYRLTRQRAAVLRSIVGSEKSLTPVALHRRVRTEQPDIGLVTVYRTLSILAELGLICEVRREENTRRYVRSPLEHHDHLVCRRCGKVVNFTNCNVAELEEKLARETGFAIQSHHLELTGYCRDCRQ